MRTATKSTLGLVSLGLFAASYQIGLTAETGFNFAEPSATESTNPDGAASSQIMAEPTPTASTASVTKTGDVIDVGKGYGFVQVEVVKKGDVITTIKLLRAESSDGRDKAFPSLVAAAIKANGSNFGNISNATYTTNAFKKAVESALAKF
ncbi:FMN-binding protein [Rhodoluna limnophila]|uniref:FMN-binding protein n=1 Tax=Rhodoluna limnophila TaxID=232537 RepID=UPI0011062902|nr:FMN-binding protein [Rhodoluna limnophila]